MKAFTESIQLKLSLAAVAWGVPPLKTQQDGYKVKANLGYSLDYGMRPSLKQGNKQNPKQKLGTYFISFEMNL